MALDDDALAKLAGMMKGMIEEGLAPLSSRLQQLEMREECVTDEQGNDPDLREASTAAAVKEEVGEVMSTKMLSREKQLTKTFGNDTSAPALLEFLDHYVLCVEMNKQRGIPGWNNPAYRAKELRFQLEGEAAVYVRQEETMLEKWVEDEVL